jgi:hypothetical protein
MANYDDGRDELTQNNVSQHESLPNVFDHLDEYWKKLVDVIFSQKEEPVLGESDGLQRLNLLHLLNQIAQVKATVRHNHTTSKSEMESLRVLMHQYGEHVNINSPLYIYIVPMQPNLEWSKRSETTTIYLARTLFRYIP